MGEAALPHCIAFITIGGGLNAPVNTYVKRYRSSEIEKFMTEQLNHTNH